MIEKYNEVIEAIKEAALSLKYNDVRVVENDEHNELTFTFSKYSPFGQDFCFDIFVKVSEDDEPEDVLSNFIDELDNFYEGYDVCYETYLWLDEWGHGKNGAPYDMRDLYNDFEACEKYIEDLLDKVKEIEI